MFGLFRTVLAVNVVAFHVLGVPSIGPYAVFSFFVLSGFLMTLIVHGSYGYSLDGFRRYAINRFLRLYPVYWAVAIFSMALLFGGVGAEFTFAYHAAIQMPQGFDQWFSNISMIFPAWEPITIEPRILPATWALTIEIFFYVLIGLGLSRNKTMTTVWFVLSLIYAFTPLFQGAFRMGYGDFLSASLPFSIGAMVYFYHNEITTILSRACIGGLGILTGAYGLFLACVVILSLIWPDQAWKINYLGIWVNLLLTAFLVNQLFKHGKTYFSPQVDKHLGDYSYPVYLMHWTVAATVSYAIFGRVVKGFSTEGALVFLITVAVSLVLSVAVNKLVNDPIEQLRKKFRRAQRAG